MPTDIALLKQCQWKQSYSLGNLSYPPRPYNATVPICPSVIIQHVIYMPLCTLAQYYPLTFLATREVLFQVAIRAYKHDQVSSIVQVMLY